VAELCNEVNNGVAQIVQ